MNPALLIHQSDTCDFSVGYSQDGQEIWKKNMSSIAKAWHSSNSPDTFCLGEMLLSPYLQMKMENLSKGYLWIA